MDWEKQVMRRTLEGAGEYPSVQLQFLLMDADELDAEGRRRNGRAEIVNLKK